MYKKAVLFILVVIGFGLFGMARMSEENREKFQVKLESIFEKAATDTIVEEIVNETEMSVSEARVLGVEGLEGRESSEKVIVKYPKVIMVSSKEIIERYGESLIKSIKFFNEKGNLKKDIDVQGYIPEKKGPARVGVSQNGKYLRINAPVEVIPGKEVLKSRIVVFNTEGDSLWGFKHKLQNIYLSPNGEYMVGVPDLEWGDAPVFMYDKDGNILKKIEKEDQSCDISFSNDGSYFAVLVTRINYEMKTEKHGERYSADLVVVDAQGNELWRKEEIAIGYASKGRVNISNDTISVITGFGEYKIYHFNKDGKLLKTEQSNVEHLMNFKD
ncbi:hypothetical protein KAW18_18145 [candidate division WOR-3 bacterium]|nr:hypothetical protein [candidate division WOR-3 bacterium]MCK4529288.1 hypothetical protein [candidate division WOR-3 bacterium]